MLQVPKVFPAGTGEKTQYLAHNSNDNTIRFVLHYPGRVQAGLLQQATQALVESVNVLHASFIPGNLGAYWHVNRQVEPEDYFTHLTVEGDPMPAARTAALRAMDPAGKAQLHCTLVESPQGCAVTLVISHLCVDGGDGKYLLNKLAEAYNLAAVGDLAMLRVKNGSRATEQMYEELTPKEYLSLLKSPLGGTKTGFPYGDDRPGEPCFLQRSVPAPVMAAARARAKAADATVNDLLLAACYRAYATLPGAQAEGAVGIMSMMDLRRHCKDGESEGLCNMSGFLPTALQNGVQGTFADTLAEVAAQTRAAKQDPAAGMEGMPLLHSAMYTVPLRLLLEVAERVYGSMSIGLTNLGNIPCAPLSLGGVVPDGGLFGGPLKKKPAMQVSAASFDGTAVLCVVNEATQEDAALLDAMLCAAVREITAYAAG